MSQLDITKIRYLMDWTDRDKCLLVACGFFLLQLFYWISVNLIAADSLFWVKYGSREGLVLTQWVMLFGLCIWTCLVAWGGWLRRQKRESRLYEFCFLYSFCLPLIAQGQMIGLYNPLMGIMLLGSVLTGAVLFDFRRIVGPLILAVVLLAFLAWATIHHYLTYMPLLRMNPINKVDLSGFWIVAIMTASLPFVLGVLAAAYFLLSRWKEREEQVRLMSVTDILTGVPNRRAVLAQAGKELHRAGRNNEPVAVVMMDLDHFKQVNDTFGHAAGDQALKQVGKLLKRVLRRIDLLGRIGGEEFVLVLPQTSSLAASQVVERCRRTIAETPVDFEGGKPFTITASFGICVVEKADGIELGQLLQQADVALYHAKRNGRNCAETIAYPT